MGKNSSGSGVSGRPLGRQCPENIPLYGRAAVWHCLSQGPGARDSDAPVTRPQLLAEPRMGMGPDEIPVAVSGLGRWDRRGREGSGDGGEKSQTQKTLATPEDL